MGRDMASPSPLYGTWHHRSPPQDMARHRSRLMASCQTHSHCRCGLQLHGCQRLFLPRGRTLPLCRVPTGPFLQLGLVPPVAALPVSRVAGPCRFGVTYKLGQVLPSFPDSR